MRIPQTDGPDLHQGRRPALLLRLTAGVAVAASLTLAACDQTPERAPDTDATASPVAGAAATLADTSARLPAGARRVTLAVRGMSCESCERTIAVMLRRAPGVHMADVSVERREAVVTFDPTRTNPTALVAVVRQLGYRATAPGA